MKAADGLGFALAQEFAIWKAPEALPGMLESLIRRSPKPRPAVGRRAVLELTDGEAAHLARFPLMLTDAHGGRILVPAGAAHGDQLVLHDRGELIVIRVRVHGKGLTVLH